MAQARAGGNGPTPEKPTTPEDRRSAYRLGELMEQAGKVSPRTLVDVASSPDEPKQAIVRDLIYPGAWLLVGRPKIGKSWLLLQLALAVAEHDTFLGFNCEEGEVLLVLSEDDEQRVRERLRLLGVLNAPEGCYLFTRADLPKIARQFGEGMSFETWLGLWLQQHPKVRLVLLDTEVTVRQLWRDEVPFDGSRIVETDYRRTRLYDELALGHKVAILLVNHTGKVRGGKWFDPHELINRSNTAVAGASGSMVLVDPPDADMLDPRQKTRVFAVRGRDLPHDINLGVHQDEDMPRFISDGIWWEVRQSQGESQIMGALLVQEEARGFDPVDWVGAGELGKYCGKSAATVSRVLARMVKKKRSVWKQYKLVSKQGRGGGYRLERITDNSDISDTGKVPF